MPEATNVFPVDFVSRKKSRPPAENPDLVELAIYQESYQVELVCIDCLHRWETLLVETMPTRLIECPACKKVGTIVCQP